MADFINNKKLEKDEFAELDFDFRKQVFKQEIKDLLKKLKQAEISELATKLSINSQIISPKEQEKAIIQNLLKRGENKNYDQNILALIPTKHISLSYYPRSDKFNDSLMNKTVQERAKNDFIIKKLANNLIESSKETDNILAVNIAKKLKYEAMLFGAWMPTDIYLKMAEKTVKKEKYFHNADGSINQERKKLLIKDEEFYKDIKFIHWDHKKHKLPDRAVKSEEKMKFLFLTEQQGKSIEYLYANYAKAGLLEEFFKTYNFANKHFEKIQNHKEQKREYISLNKPKPSQIISPKEQEEELELVK